jgi:hypothetical protein
MAAKKRKAKKAKAVRKAKRAPARKTKAPRKAKKSAKKVKRPARKAAKRPAKKAKAAARKAPTRKAPARKAKPAAKKKKQIVGEGDYAASRAFLKDQSGFVEKNKGAIPAMGKAAEKALEGPEGDSLRDAEATAAARSRDTF